MVVSSITTSSPSKRSAQPSPTRRPRRDGRQHGGSGGAFSGLFRRMKRTNNKKRVSNDDITRLPEDRDGDGEVLIMNGGGGVVSPSMGVEARMDDNSTINAPLEQIDDLSQIVQNVEKAVRQVVLYCIAFLAGTKSSPELVFKVGKLLELSAVAWGTCVAIITMGWIQTHRMYRHKKNTWPTAISSAAQFSGSRSVEKELESFGRENDVVVLSNLQQQHHYLENLYIMMGPQQRVYPNSIAVDIDTDMFSGKMLLMFRTPEVDEGGMQQPCENPIVTYFRGKQRRFEFQWQFKLKKIPQGDIYFCAELDEPVQMGMIQRALTSTALKFVRKMNQGFSYYLSDSHDSPSYLSFPLGTSMDRFTSTKPGQPLPKLGQEIMENVDTMRQRKKGMKIEWNVDDVYTMAIWSAYLDWVDFKLMNFPGIRPFAVTSVAGVQPIKLTLFTTVGESKGEDSVLGNEVKRNIVFSMEVSNAEKSTLGKDAKAWIAAQGESEQAAKIELRQLPQLPDLDEDEKSADTGMLETLDDVDEGSDESASDGDMSDEEEFEECESEEIAEAVDANVDNGASYLRSGSSLSLRERIGSFVSSGGNYAVLQSSSTSSIVIETVHSTMTFSKSTSSQQSPSLVIRSGDIVRLKFVDASTKAIRYLTLHHRWWLRWSSFKPKKNGSFCIRTNERNGTPISMGQPFSLESRRWSRYLVGAMQSSSAKYGGRMLGLYKATGPLTDSLEPEVVDHFDITQPDDIENKGYKFMPLLLCADVYDTSRDLSPQRVKINESLNRQDSMEENSSYHETSENESVRMRYVLDVPVYIEMMNRTKRIKQRVYVVRAKECHNTKETNEGNMLKGKVVMKLRTGHSLASVLRVGLNDLGNKSDLPTGDLTSGLVSSAQRGLDDDSDSSSSDESESDNESESSDFLIAGPNHSKVNATFLSECDNAYAKLFPFEQQVDLTPGSHVVRDDPSPDSLATFEVLMTPGNQSEPFLTIDTPGTNASKRRRSNKHAAVLSKVAKTLKSSTVVTGKHVIKHSKNIGKGTVNAGRAAGRKIPVTSVVHSKRPKKHEPTGRVHREKSEDQMKRLVKETKRFDGPSSSGQLLTPDYLRIKVSHLLSEISSLKSPSERTSETISALVNTNSQSDLAFLRGGAAELGVIPLETIHVDFDYECVVARSIWEGRWREELCALYSRESHLSFYAPLTKKPSLVVSFDEIISVRKCVLDTEANPLPGFHILAIDTAWRCHYLAFLESNALEVFSAKLRNSLFLAQNQEKQNKAQEWETFLLSLESALTGTLGHKWASVSTGRKSHQKKERRVLNGRRLSFDLKPVASISGGSIIDVQSDIASFVENLLKMALSFSPDTLDATESSFIEFLDEASRLRSLPLNGIDFTSREALCIFVNLYHCLLQHSLLIAVDGLPDKVSIYLLLTRLATESNLTPFL